MICYGDEIAMAGGGGPDNRRDFPGRWKADAHNAFEIAGRSPEEESVPAHVKQLLQLRQGLSPFRRGDFAAAKSLTYGLGKLGTVVVGEGKVKLTLAARSTAVLTP